MAAILAGENFEVMPLHFCLYPRSSRENSLKALKSLRELRDEIGFEEAIIFPWAGILNEILEKIRENYVCVACRRSMLSTASKICRREGASGIVTGESLGQKASQTIENVNATSSEIKVPLLRPLLGMNKEEIIQISKNREIWRADHAGCCLATPPKPRTKADSETVNKEMKKIDLQGLIQESENFLKKVEDFDWDFEEYLFELAAEFE